MKRKDIRRVICVDILEKLFHLEDRNYNETYSQYLFTALTIQYEANWEEGEEGDIPIK